jgi:F-type H+-transporting ATPase subunit a
MQAEAQAADNMGKQVGEMIMHHITNSPMLDLGFTKLHLPAFAPIDVGGVSIDLSITKVVVFMMLAAVLLILMALTIRRKIGLVPRGLANFVEALVLFIRDDIAAQTMGKHAAEKYTGYLCTTFFFILTCNLLGLVPLGASATGSVSVTAALAIVAFFMIQFAGIRKLGIGGWLGHLLPPGVPWWLAPVMIVVELLGMFAKPFALCIRLFANMVAGHVVILSLIGLFFILGWAIAPITAGFGLFMYVLEIFVALLQAYVFTMLTSLFIGLLVHGEH